MNTKLTLRLDKTLIELAKRYSTETGKSLSKLVSEYFQAITQNDEIEQGKDAPLVHSLRGVLKESDLSEKDYKEHLESKYL